MQRQVPVLFGLSVRTVALGQIDILHSSIESESNNHVELDEIDLYPLNESAWLVRADENLPLLFTFLRWLIR